LRPGDGFLQRKSVTLSWDPSTSGDAAGYRVHLATVPPSMRYVYDVGPVTELSVYIPIGKSYQFNVVAYNEAGESPPSSDFRFDLF